MKNIVKQALCALMILAPMAPAYGMFAGLKRSIMAQRAAYSTLGARLLRNTPTFKVAVERPTTVQVQPATKRTLGFFASLPLIGWLFQTEEEKCAQKIIRHKAIKNSLTSATWNPNHPVVAQFVYERCERNRYNENECGQFYNNVKEQLSKERLRALDILSTKNKNRRLTQEEELREEIIKLAKNYTKTAMRAKVGNKSIAQASDTEIAKVLSSSVEKEFAKCKDKEVQERLCTPARTLAFQRLKTFRDAAQGKLPVTPVQQTK